MGDLVVCAVWGAVDWPRSLEGVVAGEGFRALSKVRRQEVAASGGRASWEKGTAHAWTRKSAQSARRVATGVKHTAYPMRKREGKYEYLVPWPVPGNVKNQRWVSRQLVHQMRKRGELL
jgi:hypothetical protein